MNKEENINIEEIAKRYESGENISDLLEEYDIDSKQLFYELIENYYYTKRKEKELFEIQDEEKKDIYKLFKSGTLISILEKKYCTTRNVIISIISELDISILSDKQQEIYSLYKSGTSIADLIKMYNTTYKVINYFIKQIEYYKPQIEIPIEEIAKAYLENNLDELSKKYDVKVSSLYYRLQKFYGNQYRIILTTKNEEKITKELVELYEKRLYNIRNISIKT